MLLKLYLIPRRRGKCCFTERYVLYRLLRPDLDVDQRVLAK